MINPTPNKTPSLIASVGAVMCTRVPTPFRGTRIVFRGSDLLDFRAIPNSEARRVEIGDNNFANYGKRDRGIHTKVPRRLLRIVVGATGIIGSALFVYTAYVALSRGS